MPIPVGRSGNVDGEGRTANGIVRDAAVVGSRRASEVRVCRCVRIRVEPFGEQQWIISWTVPARRFRLCWSRRHVYPAFMELVSEVDELENTDNGDGTDGS
jgi:hypothetical protein